jgi:hypothetical protein
LTALFRARVALDQTFTQTLVLCVKGQVDDKQEATLKQEVRALFDATAAEADGNASFQDLYNVLVVSVTTQEEADEVCIGYN